MEDLFSFRSLWQAYRSCRRRKRGSANAQRYEVHLLDHLVETLKALQSRQYAPSRSLCFLAQQPKMREIHAADFTDRVVHHLLVPRLEVLYEPIFIHDLYSNRKGRGIHSAVERLGHFMRSVSDNGNKTAWFLQLDIRNFFNTIDRIRLLGMIKRRFLKAVEQQKLQRDEANQLYWLTKVILQHNPAENVTYRGDLQAFKAVPDHKRLSMAAPGKGLPIGNLPSQFFANVYMNELDQFIKHQLKCRYYLRYVDDFILLDPNQVQLQQWQHQIEQFLNERLDLQLKAGQILRPTHAGADFLGYIVRPHYRLVRRRVVGNLRDKLRSFQQQLWHGGQLNLSPQLREQLRAALASYLGHFRHANSNRLQQQIWSEFGWLKLLFESTPTKLRPRWEPQSVTSFRSQWRYFSHWAASIVQRAPIPISLIQMGRSVMLFNRDVTVLLEQIPRLLQWRGVKLQSRSGFEQTLEFSFSSYRSLNRKLQKQQISFLFVAEEGFLRGGLKRRALRTLYIAPCPPETSNLSPKIA